MDFLDEADTANKYAAELRNEHGVRAIVVLLHEGGIPTPFAGIDSCNVAGAGHRTLSTARPTPSTSS